METKQIIAAIERYESDIDESVTDSRTKALDYYLGEKRGDEVDGRSQVIARNVYDVVEWIKPQICEIFCSGDEVVSFAPRGPEDVQAAEQETEYVNWIITQRNSWFDIFLGWSHDALLQKVGYVKAYWDDSTDDYEETYKGFTIEELMALQADPYAEIIEQTVEDTEFGERFDVKVVHKKPCATVRLQNIAPENIKVPQSVRHLNLQDKSIPFVEHAEKKPISELRAMGLDVPDDINDGAGSTLEEWEEQSRNPNRLLTDDHEADPSMRMIKVREVWMRIDEDEDGIAELMHYIVVGNEILLSEKAPFIPVVAMSPNPLPHQHDGLSAADAVMDLQDISTALVRGSLDNLYLANNGRFAIDADSVNLDDMLVSRPGGVVRVSGNPAQSIMPLTHSTTGQIALPMLEYIDRTQQKRTGVNEQAQGMADTALNQTATLSEKLSAATQQRIKFIARVFAEIGVKSLFRVVHALTLMNSRQVEMMRLRGRWIPVDPRQWVKRDDLIVSVGLGTGDRPQQMGFLDNLIKMQMSLAPHGLASPQNVYATVKRLIQTAGYKNSDEFITDPSLQPPQQPQPPLPLVIEDMKQKGAVAIEQAKAQQAMAAKRAELELQASNDARDSEREVQRARLDAELEAMRIQSNERLKAMEMAQKAELERMKAENDRYIAELNNQVKLQVASIDDQRAAQGQEIDRMAKAPAPIVQPVELPDITTGMNQLAALVANMHGQMNAMFDKVNAPKKRRIIRDAEGRAIGIEQDGVSTPIERDATGKIIGI